MPSPTRRSVFFGLTSGAGLATGGTIAGGMLAGLAGSVAIGAAGLLGGTAVGDRLITARRKLTDFETEYAREIFHDSVNLAKVRVTRDGLVSVGAPKGVRHTIHLKSDWGHFVDDSLDLSEIGLYVLIHELGHVWQYQNGGLAYIPGSLWSQYRGWRTTGSRNAAYDWLSAHKSEIPWHRWNPEQQATAIEDYNRCLRRLQSDKPRTNDEQQLELLEPYVTLVRERRGAPRFLRRG